MCVPKISVRQSTSLLLDAANKGAGIFHDVQPSIDRVILQDVISPDGQYFSHDEGLRRAATSTGSNFLLNWL